MITKKMSENGEIYTAGKKFTLLPAVMGWTNSTSGVSLLKLFAPQTKGDPWFDVVDEHSSF